jgi:hypothetical protein
MATVREILDAGCPLDPETAEQQDQAIRCAHAWNRVAGSCGPTGLGSALAMEPQVLKGLAVKDDHLVLPLCAVLTVEVTKSGRIGETEFFGPLGPHQIALVWTGPKMVLVSHTDTETLLRFNPGVIEIAVQILRAPAQLRAVLELEVDDAGNTVPS